MTEPAETVRAPSESPEAPHEPVEEPRARAGARRGRRRAFWAALTGLAVVAVAVPLLNRPADKAQEVIVGSGPEATVGGTEVPTPPTSPPTTTALEFVAGRPIVTRLDFVVPEGWLKLLSDGERLLLSTRPLSDADRALALLARNDAAFSSAFPPDAVVVAVGGDPVEAKYGTAPDGSAIAPGPAYALGPEKALAGGVRVRRGDIPQSIVKIASYAGPSAPAARRAEAETIAAGIRLVRTGDPSVRPPPPPVGSRPGLPAGPLPVAEAGLPEVARAAAAGSTVVLVAGQDCAYLRWVDAQPSLPGYEPLAGACLPPPSGNTITAAGPAVTARRGPDTQPAVVTVFRNGPSIGRFTARLADGTAAPVSRGTDGWAIVVGSSRVVAVTGIDTQGRTVAEQVVS